MKVYRKTGVKLEVNSTMTTARRSQDAIILQHPTKRHGAQSQWFTQKSSVLERQNAR